MTEGARENDDPPSTDGFEAEELLKMQERVGMVVGGKYKIVRALGVGGMGGVYEAEHQLIGKKVALKCLHREYAREKDLVERFKREARAATVIGHENIVDVTDMGDLPDGAPFLVMEILRGTALAGLMDQLGPLPIGRAVRITRQVCSALQAAHDKGIVHRDMKPENVFLTTRGGDPDFVKVLDFGISKMHAHGKSDRGLTRTGVAMGTPSYMSPEQAQGSKDVDARTDVWAVGVMLYEMLSATRPFEADSYPMMLMAIVGKDPSPVRYHRKDVPEALDAIVMRCLEKPVGTRVQSMNELYELLAPFASVEGEPDMHGGGDRRAQATSAPRRKLTPAEEREEQAHARTMHGGGTGEREPSQRTPTPVTRVAGSTPISTKSASTSGTVSRSPGLDVDAGTFARVPESDRPPPPEASTKDRAPQATGVLGTAERASPRSARQHTAEMEPADAPAPKLETQSTALYAGGAVVLVLLALGGAWAGGVFGGGDPPPVPAPPPVVAPPPPVATPPVVEPPPVVEAAVPAEIHLDITTNPANATLEIGEVTFPNPLSAARPRSLDPVTIRVSLDGYQTIERLVILDQSRSYYFELARGRGVRLEDAEGRVREPHHGTTPPAETHETHETPPSGSSGGSGGDRFREEF